MSALRVLHIASFVGNIGDNANHMGFRPWFQSVVGRPVQWTSLEIREFYWKERQWDDALVELANGHDLLIVGGGNYFELWVESSPTGTSVAIEPETFAKLRIPVLFNALGVDPGQGVSDQSLARFRSFIDLLLADTRYLVTVRNDGAKDNLRTHLGDAHADKVLRVPDAGFFCPVPAPAAKTPDTLRIGINIASDMPQVRFAGFANSGGMDGFVDEMAFAIGAIADRFPQSEYVLVPHIFRDIEIISNLIGRLNDRLRRTRLSVASYGSGDAAAEAALSVYASCDAVLATRFHANVCPLGLGRQTLGLSGYPQIGSLYNELGQPDRAIDVSNPGFADTLVAATTRTLTEPNPFSASPADALQNVAKLRSAYEIRLLDWLRQNALRV